MPLRNALFLAAVAFAQSAPAASFSTYCDGLYEQGSGCSVLLTGPITEGDRDRLLATLRRAPLSGWRYRTLVLDSPGGSVREALALSEVVVSAMLETSTIRWGPKKKDGKPADLTQTRCASACVLVWAVGAHRTTTDRGIGLHRPVLPRETYSEPPTTVASRQAAANSLVLAHLDRFQFPRSLSELMIERASTQIHWVTDNELPFKHTAAWFEELLIARCDFDPTRAAHAESAEAARLQRHFESQLAPSQYQASPGYAEFEKWRRDQYACEYGIRLQAQQQLAR